MEIGIVGKPSSGKSTFFKAATLIDVAISPRPFTTIKPNIGTSYVTAACPCKELGKACAPRNSKCVGGVRLVPVRMIDVAGLVPGAHEGRGLGNQFLDDLRQADALIHVVDASGKTDADGNICEGHDPCEDIVFLEEELNYWILGILQKHWHNVRRRLSGEKVEDVLADVLSGLGMTRTIILEAIRKSGGAVDESSLSRLACRLREIGKPIIIAANKIDLPNAEANLKRMKEKFPDKIIVPVCAVGELALRSAEQAGAITYLAGSNKFEKSGTLTPEQEKGLGFIREKILEKYGSTGVQKLINTAVFEMLSYIVAYPVEDETHFSDKKGAVLPDAYLLKPGSTTKDLAATVHTDLAKNFIFGVDARTKRRIGAEKEIENGGIVRIVSGK